MNAQDIAQTYETSNPRALNDEKNTQDYAALELKLRALESKLYATAWQLNVVKGQRDEALNSNVALTEAIQEGNESCLLAEIDTLQRANRQVLFNQNELRDKLAKVRKQRDLECKWKEELLDEATQQRHWKEAAHAHHKKEVKKIKQFGANNKSEFERLQLENEVLRKGLKVALRTQVMSIRSQVKTISSLGLDVSGVDYV